MYKILTKSGVENTNQDGARDSWFASANRNGIVKGVLQECKVTANGNTITLNTGELRIAGHRILIESPESITLSDAPATVKVMQLCAQIYVGQDGEPDFSLFVKDQAAELTQNNLYATESGSGLYQVIIREFSQSPSGNIGLGYISLRPIVAGYPMTNSYIGTSETTAVSQKGVNDAYRQVRDLLDKPGKIPKSNGLHQNYVQGGREGGYVDIEPMLPDDLYTSNQVYRVCALIQTYDGSETPTGLYLLEAQAVGQYASSESGYGGSEKVTLTTLSGATKTSSDLLCVMKNGSDSPYTGQSLEDMKYIYLNVRSAILLQWYDVLDPTTCFIEGTQVLMADGSEKAIEEVAVGDEVAFYDAKSGERKKTTVVLPPVGGECGKYNIYTFSDGTELNVYGEQRIWREEDREYRFLSEFTVGEHTRNAVGEVLQLTGVREVKTEQSVRHYYLLTGDGRYSVNAIQTVTSDHPKYFAFLKSQNAQYRPDAEEMHRMARGVWKRILKRTPYNNPMAKEAIQAETRVIGSGTEEIQRLKAYLTDTDYIVMKHTEGVLTDEEFEAKKIIRQNARDRINVLEENIRKAEEKIEAVKDYWRIKITRDTYASFAPDTVVTMKDGKEKNIREVAVGESVRYLGDNGALEESLVVLPPVPELVLEYQEIRFRSGDVLRISGNRQEFFNASIRKYVNSGDLEVGDRLRFADGSESDIVSITKKYYDGPQVFWRLATFDGDYTAGGLLTRSWRGRAYKELMLPENEQYRLDAETMEKWRKDVEG